MQLVRERSSLTIVLVIYLQVFASPFHKYYQRCTDCQPICSSAQTAVFGTARPAPVRRAARVKQQEPGNGTEGHANEKVGRETVIVSDPPPSAPSSRGRLSLCDRLAQSLSDTPKGLLCVDYRRCPSIENEPSDRVRQLTCGIQIDGSIRVCCNQLEPGALSGDELEQPDESSLVVSADEVLELEGQDSSSSPARQSEGAFSLNVPSRPETLVVSDSQPLSTAGVVQVTRASSARSRAKSLEAAQGQKNQLRQSDLAEASRFPSECGQPQGDENNQDETRIIGGKSARRNAWPWFALIMTRRGKLGWQPECGATLISNRHVLTAAHCVLDRSKRPTERKRLLVRLGERDLTKAGDGEQNLGVEQITAHAEFNFKSFRNDIALLKLDRPVTFNDTIMPACLPHDQPKLADQKPGAVDNQTAWVLGFGQTSYDGRTSDQLLQADLRIVQQIKCKRAFSHLVRLTPDYVCASSQVADGVGQSSSAAKIKDSCQGDSGGPLMMLPPLEGLESRKLARRWYLYGIVSFGYRCASAGFPGVYTRVNRYLDWISNNMT